MSSCSSEKRGKTEERVPTPAIIFSCWLDVMFVFSFHMMKISALTACGLMSGQYARSGICEAFSAPIHFSLHMGCVVLNRSTLNKQRAVDERGGKRRKEKEKKQGQKLKYNIEYRILYIYIYTHTYFTII